MTPAGTNLLLAHADAAADDVVTKSLRFGGDGYLDRASIGTPTDATKFTASLWLKRNALGGDDNIIAGGTSGYDWSLFRGITSDDRLFFDDFSNGTTNYAWRWSPVLRDVASWYHLLLVWDASQTATTDKMKLYINGSEVTSDYTLNTPATDHQISITKSGMTQWFGRNATGGSADHQIADAYLIDGQALTPTSFAEEDETTGQWKPKEYSGSGYGTNGFHLDFEDDTDIGNDVSGNDNDFTATNLAASDVVLDNPSAGSNFCTLNPLDISRGTLSEGNTKYTASTSTWGQVRSTFAASTGKWYWETTLTLVSELQATVVGILESNKLQVNTYWYHTSWSVSTNGNCYGAQDNNLKVSNGTQTLFTHGASTGSVYGFHLDLDSATPTLALSVDGVDKGTMFSGLAAVEYSPALNLYGDAGGQSIVDVNFGQGDPNGNNNYQDGNGKGNFKYEPDSGFLAWCTNSQTATIAKPAENFDVLTYASSGAKTFDNGTTSMQPDLVWVKARGNAYDHELTDSVRGVTKALSSNATNVESTDSTGLTAFGSDGFTVGAGTNYSTSAMVAWCWKKSAAAGFNIVGWTGDDVDAAGTTQAVTHGLDVAPEMIIVKKRTDNSGGSNDWFVYHKDLSSGYYLLLNTTDGETEGLTYPITSIGITSATFGGDFDLDLNYGGDTMMDPDPPVPDTYIGYFMASVAGHSIVGSFIGSSAAFIYTGFRPAFILAKRYDEFSTGNWLMFDDQREGYNVDNDDLMANSSAVEATTDHIDILSNGFKIRTSDADLNGGTVIYLAVAKNPFKYANAR